MTHSSLDSSPHLHHVFLCNDLTMAGEISWVEDYYKHRLPSIAGASFPLHHVVFLLGFSAPWLETTLLVRMCFTCAGPAEVIKASAASRGSRGRVGETRSFGKLMLAQAISVYTSCTISWDKLCLSCFRWTRHYCSLPPDFFVW